MDLTVKERNRTLMSEELEEEAKLGREMCTKKRQKKGDKSNI